jgi:hypothetical protein
MKHVSEEELIAYHQGELQRRQEIADHLASCGACRGELGKLEAFLKALEQLRVPDPGEDFERRAWQRLAPRLPEKRLRWWRAWLEPRRAAAFAGVAAVAVLAFVVGRLTVKPSTKGGAPALGAEQVRERVLVVAVGEHLGKSEMMLIELANAEPTGPKAKQVNISAEQKRAEDLLDENRLYRQTALQQGDTALASVLDELERTLLDVAHSPDEVTPAQLESLQKRMEARGILFKVRVVNQELQQREKAHPAPEQKESIARERNKA